MEEGEQGLWERGMYGGETRTGRDSCWQIKPAHTKTVIWRQRQFERWREREKDRKTDRHTNGQREREIVTDERERQRQTA